MLTLINARCSLLYSNTLGHDCIWYYDIFNEGPAWQLGRMLDDSSAYDDYFPSLYTQNTQMNEILTSGIFSWVKWKSDTLYSDSEPSVSCCFSMIHTIGDSVWGGLSPGFNPGTDTTQANSVRAYFNTQYLEYSLNLPYRIRNNYPERMDLNTYPVRMAGYDWQDNKDSISVLGSATDLWMLEHYELLMDSTFIPAGTEPNGPYPVHYHPQGFGRTGGRAIWKIVTAPVPDTTVNYTPYSYRIPSPGEFRMLCNIGLLRGAKGVFPYSIRSYEEWKDDTLLHHDTGLLDENLIPFDAPYENWVYRDRPTGDYWYAPPDSIPPWTAADGSQFDPLYTVPPRPQPPTAAKTKETYLEWKFAAYARLWNSVKRTFGQIATVAPELSRLWWWYSGNRYDDASISYNGTEPQYFADPQVRVFTDSTESTCYLFYVNRFCRANNNPFSVAINTAGFPGGTPFSVYALDHSRRFLIEGSLSLGVYTFPDTLDAGEARLLEMFDGSLAADLRITDPDIFVVIPADGDTLTDNGSTTGTAFDIHAWVYNMGTEPLNNVKVYLQDVTADTLCDSVYLSFSGLSTSSCYQADRALASFQSITPDTSAVGANIFRVFTDSIPNEPDPSDNSATLVYMVRPQDYATEVLDDPWDMTEVQPPRIPPAWNTNDIDSLTGCWNTSAYTDSISGMFEGVLTNPTQANALYLNVGSGSSDYIDADIYSNLSLAGRSSVKAAIELHWVDSDNDTSSVALGDTLRVTAGDIGPIDISTLTAAWSGNIKKIWLEFTAGSGNLSSNVRIGWVKLTE